LPAVFATEIAHDAIRDRREARKKIEGKGKKCKDEGVCGGKRPKSRYKLQAVKFDCPMKLFETEKGKRRKKGRRQEAIFIIQFWLNPPEKVDRQGRNDARILKDLADESIAHPLLREGGVIMSKNRTRGRPSWGCEKEEVVRNCRIKGCAAKDKGVESFHPLLSKYDSY